MCVCVCVCVCVELNSTVSHRSRLQNDTKAFFVTSAGSASAVQEILHLCSVPVFASLAEDGLLLRHLAGAVLSVRVVCQVGETNVVVVSPKRNLLLKAASHGMRHTSMDPRPLNSQERTLDTLSVKKASMSAILRSTPLFLYVSDRTLFTLINY